MSERSQARSTNAPRVFIDADAIIAAAFAGSVESAGYVLLLLGEATLLDCITSRQVLTEVTRNVERLMPGRALEAELIIRRACRVVDDPSPDRVANAMAWAHAKDAPILAAAIEARCSVLVTFNVRHFAPPPDIVAIATPGAFLQRLRGQLAGWA